MLGACQAGPGRGCGVLRVGGDQLSPCRIPLAAAGSAFGKTDANYFLIVLAFLASSLLPKKEITVNIGQGVFSVQIPAPRLHLSPAEPNPLPT